MKKILLSTIAHGCILLALWVSVPFAAGDVIHITSGFSLSGDTPDRHEWDVDSDGTFDYAITYDDSFSGGSRDVNFVAPTGTGALFTGPSGVLRLTSPFVVGPDLPVDSWQVTVEALTTALDPLSGLEGFSLDSPGYIGLRFESGGSFRYGWALLTVTEGVPDSAGDPTVPTLTISEWAYEDGGNAISIPVPEPSCWGLLMIGAVAGLVRHRRHKKLVRDGQQQSVPLSAIPPESGSPENPA